jgi:gluconate 2-dehydrogenase gamma chain
MSAINRREFLYASGLCLAGTLAGLHVPRPNAARAAAASAEPSVLDEQQWKTLEAITARIIPTDHEPGAREANCVNFIDKALAHEDSVAKPLYLGGLGAVAAMTQARHGTEFAALDAAQQDALLGELEAGTAKDWPLEQLPQQMFFETVRLHTMVGFLADPSYGGNQGYAGWRVTGYPGPRRRGFTVDEIQGKARIVPVWEKPD